MLGDLNSKRSLHNHRHELKFSEIGNKYARFDLCAAWLNSAMWDVRWTFNLCVLLVERLHWPSFGGPGGGAWARVHRRFLRSTIEYHLLRAFGNAPVHVTNIFHDREGLLETDSDFAKYALPQLNRNEPRITYASPDVIFINSDHAKEPVYKAQSHFIQFIDCIIGATRQAVHSPNDNEARRKLAEKWFPIVARLNDSRKCRNPNSRYQHYPRANLSFFPSRTLTEEEMEDPIIRAQSCFARDFPLKHGGQLPLDFDAAEAPKNPLMEAIVSGKL